MCHKTKPCYPVRMDEVSKGSVSSELNSIWPEGATSVEGYPNWFRRRVREYPSWLWVGYMDECNMWINVQISRIEICVDLPYFSFIRQVSTQLGIADTECSVDFWWVLIQIYSIFHLELSYLFTVENDYCKLNVVYQKTFLILCRIIFWVSYAYFAF